jgi:hypothetical protein
MVMLTNNKLRDLLAMSYTKRWVINPTYRESNVAEHSFRVQIIGLFLLEFVRACNDSRNVDTLHLLLDIMAHDADEVHTGDMPSTDKYTDGKVPPISDNSLKIRKVADSLETFSYWCHWGNHHVPVPHNPLNNPQGQWETKRVIEYTKDWPVLRDAAAEACKVLGVHMEGVSH